MKKCRLICLFFSVVLSLLMVIVPPLNAMGPRQKKIFELGIPYFNIDPGDCLTQLSIGDNKDYAGNSVLTDQQMKAIEANKPFYEKAVSGKNIPWQVLAVLHLREHGLARSNPRDGNLSGDGTDGAFQIINPSYHQNHSDYATVGPLTDDQFQRQSEDAVTEILAKNPGDLSNVDNVKRLFFKYNGTAGVYITQAINLGFSKEQANNGEGSPYVMNRADLKRDPTVEPTKSNGTWGQIKRDYGSIEYPANTDYGAFVVYAALGGGGGNPQDASDCNESTPLSAGNISETAKEMSAWNPTYVTGGGHSSLSDLQRRIEAKFQGDSNGVDCSGFTRAVIYRATGNDPGSLIAGPGGYASGNGILIVNGKNVTSSDDNFRKIPSDQAAAGDIFVVIGGVAHAGIIVGPWGDGGAPTVDVNSAKERLRSNIGVYRYIGPINNSGGVKAI